MERGSMEMDEFWRSIGVDVIGGRALMDSIRRLLSEDWEVVVNHIRCNSNRVADFLVKWDRNLSMDPTIFTLASAGINILVEEDQRVAPLASDILLRNEPMLPTNSDGIGLM
ncbi:hypothetical protein V6N11_076993 [Hibiscus sabdariffa]|uniref:RNase H type-1 domain-containing protein n=1 Tax=Hibiscus sabdariffa TaxID=183260 RepID=A0ABR2TC71_9ROSI